MSHQVDAIISRAFVKAVLIAAVFGISLALPIEVVAQSYVPLTHSTGVKKILYIRLRFPDQVATYDPQPVSSVQAMLTSVGDYYRTSSYGRTSWDLTNSVITPVLVMPHDQAWYNREAGFDRGSVQADASAVAKSAGWDSANFDFMVMRYDNVWDKTASAADIGGVNVFMMAAISLNNYIATFAHEMGHAYGNYHANHWRSSTIIGDGIQQEYGNPFDVMGGGNLVFPAQFGAYYKYDLGWLDEQQRHDIPFGNTGGDYVLYAHDQDITADPARQYAIRVQADITNIVPFASLDYWLQASSYFAYTKNNVLFQNGVLLALGDELRLTNSYNLLDMTPGTQLVGIDDMADGLLVAGMTLDDPTRDIHITNLGRISTSPLAFSIAVRRNTQTGNHAPVGTISDSVVNGAVTLTANVSDSDGDTRFAYYWNFGDGVGSLDNNRIQAHTWNFNGSYDVTCTVSDLKGGKVTLTKTIVVNNNVYDRPVAYITPSVSQGNSPLVVSFTTNFYNVNAGQIIAAIINYGDGVYDYASTVPGTVYSHTYSKPGTYTATFTVTSEYGAKSQAASAVIQVLGRSGPTYGNDGCLWTTEADKTLLIQAENYDTLGQGVSYNDTTAGNDLQLYRQDGVDIRHGVSGYAVDMKANEWLEYSTYLHKSGYYDIVVAASALLPPSVYAHFRISMSGQGAYGIISQTGNLDNYNYVHLQVYIQEPGYYKMELSASNDCRIDSIQINDGWNPAPNAVLQSDRVSGGTPLTVNFSASNSTDSDGSIAEYYWNFGDGNILKTTSPTATWTYLRAGTYTASLAVRDNKGKLSENAANTTIQITKVGNIAPFVQIPASASPNTVTAKSTVLSVLGSDDDAESLLSYSWSTLGTPPAAVIFSNSTAKSTTATFSKVGTYSFRCTIRDVEGLTATSDVVVVVQPTVTTIVVKPTKQSVKIGATLKFTATARDQFKVTMINQPAYTWTVTGGGTISTTGLFTAGMTAGGPYTVKASSGGVSKTTTVTVVK